MPFAIQIPHFPSISGGFYKTLGLSVNHNSNCTLRVAAKSSSTHKKIPFYNLIPGADTSRAAFFVTLHSH